MKLSIIVPVYNMASGGKLAYCMDSLVGQSLTDCEIIAVDDASTDDSLQLLRAYEQKYPEKVRVLSLPENRRQGGAKNRGLKAARGEWIAFIDSDDWVSADFYERLVRLAEETGADMAGCDYSMVNSRSMEIGKVVRINTREQTGVLDQDKHRSLLLRPGSMVVKIYRHSVIRENGLCFPEGIFYEDNCAGPLWSLYFRHFEKIDEPMYYYYQDPESTVHRITRERCEDRMQAEEIFYRECEKRGFLEAYREEIEFRFAELYYVTTLFSYMQGVKHPRPGFVRQLRRGVEARFPDFRENKYYTQLVGPEERRLIRMQARSDLMFYLYYRAKLLARRWRAEANGRGKHR